MKLYPLQVQNIVRETADTVSIWFKIPSELKDKFKFNPGQYITIETIINGEKIRRPYSICSERTNTLLGVAVKKIPDGKMSIFLNESLQIGDVIDVLPPDGLFKIEINQYNYKEYALFGAGSGITPLMSMIRSILTEEPKSKVHLLYGNRNEDTIIFKEALNQLIQESEGRLQILHTLTQPTDNWTGGKGRISAEGIQNFIAEAKIGPGANYFICGPGDFIKNANHMLLDFGVKEANIHKEYFTLPDKSNEATSVTVDLGSEVKTVEIIFEGNAHTFEIEDNATILDAAINLDIDVPYSCKVAACSTCRAKVLKGNVVMEDREILSDAEIEDGLILTCQSHPTSSFVSISFDEG